MASKAAGAGHQGASGTGGCLLRVLRLLGLLSWPSLLPPGSRRLGPAVLLLGGVRLRTEEDGGHRRRLHDPSGPQGRG